MTRITYYDLADIDYASFFVEGFLQLQKAGECNFRVSKKVPDELEDLEMTTWFRDRKPPSTSIYRFEDQAHNFLFCIDANDHNGQDPDLTDIYPGYHFPLIERVQFYFKINYHEETVKSNPRLVPYTHKIIPLPLVYPLRVSEPMAVMPNLMPFGRDRWPLKVVKRRLAKNRQLLPLDEYRRLRELPRDLDVFFVTTIYMKKSHEEINAWRLALLQAISEYTFLNTLIGFISIADDLPQSFAHFQLQPMPFKTYMSQLTRSKIGLYTRGTFGAISFKFGQYFALGKPVVGEPLLNNRQNMYTYAKFSEQFNYTEPEEIADRIAKLAADPAELQEIRELNTATFEEHFTPEAVIRQLMGHMLVEPDRAAEAVSH